MNKKSSTLIVILLVVSIIMTACASATASLSATQVITATVAPSATIMPSATPRPTSTPVPTPIDPLSLNGTVGTVSVNGRFVTIRTDETETTFPAVAWTVSHPIRVNGLTGKDFNFVREGEETNVELLVEIVDGQYRVTVAKEIDYFEDLTKEDREVVDAAQYIANIRSLFDLTPVRVEVDNYVDELLRVSDDDDPFNFSAVEACRIIKETEWIWINAYVPDLCEYNRDDPFVTYDEWKALHGVEEYTLPTTGQSLLVVFNQPERVDGDLWCSSVPGVAALQGRDFVRAHNDGHLLYSALMLYFEDGSTIPVPIYGWVAVGPNIDTLDPTNEWSLDLYQIYEVGNYELTCN